MIYSKTIQLNDYAHLPTEFIREIYNSFKDICRFEHEQRRWEYGMALKALVDSNSETVLEVGGGGSLLYPMMDLCGIDIVEIDPWDCSELLLKQKTKMNSTFPIKYIKEDFLQTNLDEQFDAVVCTSVIEHVKQHNEFFQKLLSHVKPEGILILTTDFHPSGKTFSADHLRTYTEKDLLAYAESAKGFDFLGGKYDYNYYGDYVYQYTFASLVLKHG